MLSNLRPGQELDGEFSGLQVGLFSAATRRRVPVQLLYRCSKQSPETIWPKSQDAEGLISIAGFGSLLSKDSALYTFPGLLNFRAGKVTLNISIAKP